MVQYTLKVLKHSDLKSDGRSDDARAIEVSEEVFLHFTNIQMTALTCL